jgi:hypothetical protein
MRCCKLALLLGLAGLATGQAPAQFRAAPVVDLGLLLQNESVQEALKLDKESLDKVLETLKKVREDLSEDFTKMSAADTTAADREALRKKVNDAQRRALKSVLTDGQLKRLEQMERQQRGVALLLDEDVQKDLSLADVQKDKIKDINKEWQAEVKRIGGAKPSEESYKKLQQARKEAMSKARDVLTDEQKKLLDRLTGEPFEPRFPGKPKPKPDKPGGQRQA